MNKPIAMSRTVRISIPLICLLILCFAGPALAHHPFGGMMPKTWVEGFFSGLGHPVIGPDHLVFTIILGAIATRFKPAWLMPLGFLAAALVGTGLHLMGVNLPLPETLISLSVLLFGVLAVYSDRLQLGGVVLLALCAGLFHGYAYGEAVVGAEATPLLFYLLGFTAVQGAIAASAFWVIKHGLNPEQQAKRLRYVGLIVCGSGAAFLSSVLLG